MAGVWWKLYFIWPWLLDSHAAKAQRVSTSRENPGWPAEGTLQCLGSCVGSYCFFLHNHEYSYIFLSFFVVVYSMHTDEHHTKGTWRPWLPQLLYSACSVPREIWQIWQILIHRSIHFCSDSNFRGQGREIRVSKWNNRWCLGISATCLCLEWYQPTIYENHIWLRVREITRCITNWRRLQLCVEPVSGLKLYLKCPMTTSKGLKNSCEEYGFEEKYTWEIQTVSFNTKNNPGKTDSHLKSIKPSRIDSTSSEFIEPL